MYDETIADQAEVYIFPQLFNIICVIRKYLARLELFNDDDSLYNALYAKPSPNIYQLS